MRNVLRFGNKNIALERFIKIIGMPRRRRCGKEEHEKWRDRWKEEL
jgi:hypothetical protein